MYPFFDLIGRFAEKIQPYGYWGWKLFINLGKIRRHAVEEPYKAAVRLARIDKGERPAFGISHITGTAFASLTAAVKLYGAMQ
jgi:hypothetical protein